MRSAWIINFLLLASLVFSLPNETRQDLDVPPPCSWTISADFLAWFASEEVASIWADVITSTSSATTWKVPSFDLKWDYGFRIGAGYDMEYDQWDTAFYWSWFRTDAKHTIPFQANTTFGAEFDAAFLAGLSDFTSPQSMSAKWSLLFNMFNWELGRRCWVSKNLCLRPFLGLQGGWINQSIHAQYHDLIVAIFFPTNNLGIEQLENNFWGVGPLGGINTQWRICHFKRSAIDFCGDLSAATMWGVWHCSDLYHNTLSQSYSVNTEQDSLGALMFRGFLGLKWNTTLRRGKSHFATKIGFETQLWLNQLRLATFQIQRLHHDLTLQGVTLNSQFDF